MSATTDATREDPPLRWLLACCGIAAVAHAFTETFDSGNEGNWTYGNPQVHIEPTGGNPGAYLSSGRYLDTFAPVLRTQSVASAFQGNYRAMGVTAAGTDLVQLSSFTTTGDRPCTLMLIHDNGTVGAPPDDTAAYFLGSNIPAFGEGWVSYDFDIPSGDVALPAGWQLLNLGDIGAPPIHDWNTVIQDVSRVQFFHGDPTDVAGRRQRTLSTDSWMEAGTNEVALDGRSLLPGVYFLRARAAGSSTATKFVVMP